MHFLKEFKNKKILIFGYGKTGKSVRSYFIKNRINHTIWDDNRKLNIKNIALILFIVLSFFLSHLRITIIYKSTKNYLTMCERLIYKYLPPLSNGVCPPTFVELMN